MRQAVILIGVVILAAGAGLWLQKRLSAPPPSPPPLPQTNVGVGATVTSAAAPPQLPTLEDVIRTQTPAAAAPSPGRSRDIGDAFGRALEIDLTEEPALAYGHSNWNDTDRTYAAVLKDVPGVTYDPLLGHAARELAYLYSVEDGLVPSGALEFVLMSAGAAEWGVRQSLVGTSEEGLDIVARRAAEVARAGAEGSGAMRVGVGEAWEPGARPPRTIAVIAARGELKLDPVRKEVAAGGTVLVTGQLPSGTHSPRALAMWPDFGVSDVELQQTGNRFRLTLDAGTQPGELWVEIIATGNTGPKPLAQLTFYVGQPVPVAWRGGFPPDESMYRSVEQCEARAYELLDADRRAHGLPPLRRHKALDAVARAHAEDMRDNGFFGHVSPRTGGVADRLRSARLATLSYGENVARNSSLFDAEQGLMWSLGHRVNILSKKFDHVGLGVAIEGKLGERRTFHVVQLFGTPANTVSPEALRLRVLSQLASDRRAANLPPLHLDPILQDIASSEAATVGATPAGALQRARQSPQVRGRLYAFVTTGLDEERWKPPAAVLDPEYGRVAVGVDIDPDDLNTPAQIVVLLAAESPD